MTQTKSQLTIKELTEIVGGKVTPRMVRHYHQLGLLPQPQRSRGNYRLYNDADVQRLRRIVALKQQGFQLSHIQQLLDTTEEAPSNSMAVMAQLQQHYQTLMRQLVQLRQTAMAVEGILGRDHACQTVQVEALAQLRVLEVEANELATHRVWDQLDGAAHNHPENFQQALEKLLPDLSERSEIEVDLLSQLVLACGDVSLVPFVRLSFDAVKAARDTLKQGCTVVGDIPAVVTAFDQTRLAHLGCSVQTLIDNPHINSAAEAEKMFWQQDQWRSKLYDLPDGCVLVIGYAPSVLIAVCEAIQTQQLKPALVIGLPIGFSHAPAAKRRLQHSGIPFVTTEGPQGGGLLAAVALNSLVTTLIEKPKCHCYLKGTRSRSALTK
ncbi:MAG: precorrin-8X methylmutase [Leptolyngbyaceae cyanobacterium MAG.088]|nr:precorrin-8X methylmutase [Leptolyngbyaceae cyanobacterium MAG.088]